jgi:carbamoyl-phosphate synthase large subunit
LEVIKDKDLKMVLNTPFNQGQSQSDGEKIRNMATSYGIPCFTRPENIEEVLKALFYSPHKDPMREMGPLSLQELHKTERVQ